MNRTNHFILFAGIALLSALLATATAQNRPEGDVEGDPGTTIGGGETMAFFDADCLSDEQFDVLTRSFDAGIGIVSFERADVADCQRDDLAPRGAGQSPFGAPRGAGQSPFGAPRGAGQSPFDAPRGAGVSPFAPCGVAPVPFENCVLMGLSLSAFDGGRDRVGIINPDSMHPTCFLGPNPQP